MRSAKKRTTQGHRFEKLTMAVKTLRTRSDMGGYLTKGSGLARDRIGNRDHHERKKDVWELARHPDRRPMGVTSSLERSDQHGRAERIERHEAAESEQPHRA